MTSAKAVLLTFFCFILVHSSLQAQELTKQEKKFWKDKAKMYVKNPASLKGEFENFQQQINDLKEEVKSGMASQATQVQDDQLVDSLRWELVQMEGKMQNQARQIERMEQELATSNTTSAMGIQGGLVYRVQIGAYVFYEMDSKPETGGDFVSERADGFNKYVIGSFREYEEASAFRDELKKMGLDDPWVVPYIDGIRVTIDEANQYLQNQGASILDGN
jgi:cell division protein FtsN